MSCFNCDRPANVYCSSCGIADMNAGRFCRDCSVHIHHLKANLNHPNIIDLDPQFCFQHPPQCFDSFCGQCQIKLCPQCAPSHESHHNIIAISNFNEAHEKVSVLAQYISSQLIHAQQSLFTSTPSVIISRFFHCFQRHVNQLSDPNQQIFYKAAVSLQCFQSELRSCHPISTMKPIQYLEQLGRINKDLESLQHQIHQATCSQQDINLSMNLAVVPLDDNDPLPDAASSDVAPFIHIISLFFQRHEFFFYFHMKEDRFKLFKKLPTEFADSFFAVFIREPIQGEHLSSFQSLFRTDKEIKEAVQKQTSNQSSPSESHRSLLFSNLPPPPLVIRGDTISNGLFRDHLTNLFTYHQPPSPSPSSFSASSSSIHKNPSSSFSPLNQVTHSFQTNLQIQSDTNLSPEKNPLSQVVCPHPSCLSLSPQPLYKNVGQLIKHFNLKHRQEAHLYAGSNQILEGGVYCAICTKFYRNAGTLKTHQSRCKGREAKPSDSLSEESDDDSKLLVHPAPTFLSSFSSSS